MEASARELPFPVWLAAIFGFAKAAFLALMGVIGVLAWDDVTDPWGIGALVLAALFGIASYLLMRGNRVARMVLGALAVIGGVTAVVYAFTGPTSAILPSITTAVLAAIVVWLLYGVRASKEYFGT
ncbi:MAG TPA: hypothetical protein VFJ60_14000 [Gaiella sp.]|nr:hypothetical protein [Gaiella sp.]